MSSLIENIRDRIRNFSNQETKTGKSDDPAVELVLIIITLKYIERSNKNANSWRNQLKAYLAPEMANLVEIYYSKKTEYHQIQTDVDDIINQFVDRFGDVNDPYILGEIYQLLMHNDLQQKYSAYYTTPKICELMVEKSVTQYLCTHINSKFATNFTELDDFISDGNYSQEIVTLVQQLKILDPAMGSGNFLLQSLDMLMRIYHKVGINMEERKFNDTKPSNKYPSISKFDLKPGEELVKEILCTNLLGVDIDKVAIQVFRLGLLVYLTKIKGMGIECIELVMNNSNFVVTDFLQIDDQIKQFYKPIFDRDNPGFDIIIGNPPYLSSTDISKTLGEEYKNFLGNKFPSTRSFDLSLYFSLQSLNLLRDNGVHTFLTSNKWLRSNYGKIFRAELIKRTRITYIFNLNKPKIFESLSVNTMIYSVIKAKYQENIIKYCTPSSLEDLLNGTSVTSEFNQRSLKAEKAWIFYKNQEVKDFIHNMDSKFEKLGEICSIYRGVTTGRNSVFIIDENTKNSLIRRDQKNKALLKPIVSGNQINRYHIEPSHEWLIFTQRGIDINKYPVIHDYLLQSKDMLEPRPANRKGAWKGRKKGDYKWYEIQDTTKYHLEFEKTKIMSNKAAKIPSFSMDFDNRYGKNTTYLFTTSEMSVLCYLNSKFTRFYLKQKFSRLGDNFEPKISELKQLPVPNFTKDYGKILDIFGNTLHITNYYSDLRNFYTDIIIFYQNITDYLILEYLITSTDKNKEWKGYQLKKCIEQTVSTTTIEQMKIQTSFIAENCTKERVVEFLPLIQEMYTLMKDDMKIKEVISELKQNRIVSLIMN